jgi:hypothetical protein
MSRTITPQALARTSRSARRHPPTVRRAATRPPSISTALEVLGCDPAMVRIDAALPLGVKPQRPCCGGRGWGMSRPGGDNVLARMTWADPDVEATLNSWRATDAGMSAAADAPAGADSAIRG